MNRKPQVHLFYDYLSFPGGGMGTYLDALSRHLHQVGNVPFHVWVAEERPTELVNDLIAAKIPVSRQRQLRGARWHTQKRVLMWRMAWALRPGDWVFCLSPPSAPLYLELVKLVHRRGARIAVSWFVAPEFWTAELVLPHDPAKIKQAVAETDVLISVSRCTVHQFVEVYGVHNPVSVVPYHNRLFFEGALPLPAGPPWSIGYLGRLDILQKNLDTFLRAFGRLRDQEPEVEFHLFGGGEDRAALEEMVRDLQLTSAVQFHGVYDHRHDLRGIMQRCHFFVYPSRSEGGPCFSLLELLQAGRYCLASRVGGIPDLYEGHDEAGLLLDNKDETGILEGMLAVLHRLRSGQLQEDVIRERYFDGYDMDSAHRAWLRALRLDEVKEFPPG